MRTVHRPDESRKSSSVSPSRSCVTYLGHATTLIEIDGLRILTDPLLRQRTAHLRRAMRGCQPDQINSPDLVLISHMHWDHLDIPSLRKLSPGVKVIGPRGSGPAPRQCVPTAHPFPTRPPPVSGAHEAAWSPLCGHGPDRVDARVPVHSPPPRRPHGHR
jgi:phosphoribosyl 1,2-cyclic phosphodiesterase